MPCECLVVIGRVSPPTDIGGCRGHLSHSQAERKQLAIALHSKNSWLAIGRQMHNLIQRQIFRRDLRRHTIPRSSVRTLPCERFHSGTIILLLENEKVVLHQAFNLMKNGETLSELGFKCLPRLH